MFQAIPRALVVATVLLLAGASPLFAELSAAQKQTLTTADKVLKQVETNLKLAQDAAGPGSTAIQGAKANLVKSRLAMAKTPRDQAAELVAPVPKDDAQVAALQKRLDAASAAIAAIEDRLDGKPLPASPAEAKLDFKQEQLAKDARSYLAEIEGLAGGASDVVKKVEPVKDTLTIDHRLVQSAANAIAKGRQRAALVKGRLDQLPEKGQGVALLTGQYKELVASLDASDKIIAPLHKKLSALIDPATYPELEADIKRVQELALMYQGADVLARNFDRAASLVGQLPAAKAEADRVAKAYAPLVQQKTPEGERVERMGQFFQESYAAFSAAAAKRKADLPGQIEADLAKAGELAKTAVAEKKPAFFGGGIPQVVALAESKLVLLAALDPSAASTAKAKVEKAKQQLKTQESSLKDAIIASNELPPNRYAGKDKASLEKIAVAAWKEGSPKAEILAIRFPSEQWDREKLLRFENRAWGRPIDRSHLQAQLLIKQDGKLAVVRPINLYTDHLNNNKLTAVPLDDAKDSLPPQRYLLIEKIK